MVSGSVQENPRASILCLGVHKKNPGHNLENCNSLSVKLYRGAKNTTRLGKEFCKSIPGRDQTLLAMPAEQLWARFGRAAAFCGAANTVNIFNYVIIFIYKYINLVFTVQCNLHSLSRVRIAPSKERMIGRSSPATPSSCSSASSRHTL